LKYTTKTKYINNKEYIYDPIRKKYLINSPEEWIRQNFIEYLHNKKGFPISLMATEKLTKINSLKNRSDIVCFNRQGKPILLVECKSEKIILDSNVFEQAQNYNSVLKTKYILITNGKKTLCFYVNNNQAKCLKKVPNYHEIKDLID